MSFSCFRKTDSPGNPADAPGPGRARLAKDTLLRSSSSGDRHGAGRTKPSPTAAPVQPPQRPPPLRQRRPPAALVPPAAVPRRRADTASSAASSSSLAAAGQQNGRTAGASAAGLKRSLSRPFGLSGSSPAASPAAAALPPQPSRGRLSPSSVRAVAPPSLAPPVPAPVLHAGTNGHELGPPPLPAAPAADAVSADGVEEPTSPFTPTFERRFEKSQSMQSVTHYELLPEPPQPPSAAAAAAAAPDAVPHGTPLYSKDDLGTSPSTRPRSDDDSLQHDLSDTQSSGAQLPLAAAAAAPLAAMSPASAGNTVSTPTQTELTAGGGTAGTAAGGTAGGAGGATMAARRRVYGDDDDDDDDDEGRAAVKEISQVFDMFGEASPDAASPHTPPPHGRGGGTVSGPRACLAVFDATLGGSAASTGDAAATAPVAAAAAAADTAHSSPTPVRRLEYPPRSPINVSVNYTPPAVYGVQQPTTHHLRSQGWDTSPQMVRFPSVRSVPSVHTSPTSPPLLVPVLSGLTLASSRTSSSNLSGALPAAGGRPPQAPPPPPPPQLPVRVVVVQASPPRPPPPPAQASFDYLPIQPSGSGAGGVRHVVDTAAEEAKARTSCARADADADADATDADADVPRTLPQSSARAAAQADGPPSKPPPPLPSFSAPVSMTSASSTAARSTSASSASASSHSSTTSTPSLAGSSSGVASAGLSSSAMVMVPPAAAPPPPPTQTQTQTQGTLLSACPSSAPSVSPAPSSAASPDFRPQAAALSAATVGTGAVPAANGSFRTDATGYGDLALSSSAGSTAGGTTAAAGAPPSPPPGPLLPPLTLSLLSLHEASFRSMLEAEDASQRVDACFLFESRTRAAWEDAERAARRSLWRRCAAWGAALAARGRVAAAEACARACAELAWLREPAGRARVARHAATTRLGVGECEGRNRVLLEEYAARLSRLWFPHDRAALCAAEAARRTRAEASEARARALLRTRGVEAGEGAARVAACGAEAAARAGLEGAAALGAGEALRRGGVAEEERLARRAAAAEEAADAAGVRRLAEALRVIEGRAPPPPARRAPSLPASRALSPPRPPPSLAAAAAAARPSERLEGTPERERRSLSAQTVTHLFASPASAAPSPFTAGAKQALQAVVLGVLSSPAAAAAAAAGGASLGEDAPSQDDVGLALAREFFDSGFGGASPPRADAEAEAAASGARTPAREGEEEAWGRGASVAESNRYSSVVDDEFLRTPAESSPSPSPSVTASVATSADDRQQEEGNAAAAAKEARAKAKQQQQQQPLPRQRQQRRSRSHSTASSRAVHFSVSSAAETANSSSSSSSGGGAPHVSVSEQPQQQQQRQRPTSPISVSTSVTHESLEDRAARLARLATASRRARAPPAEVEEPWEARLRRQPDRPTAAAAVPRRQAQRRTRSQQQQQASSSTLHATAFSTTAAGAGATQPYTRVQSYSEEFQRREESGRWCRVVGASAPSRGASQRVLGEFMSAPGDRAAVTEWAEEDARERLLEHRRRYVASLHSRMLRGCDFIRPRAATAAEKAAGKAAVPPPPPPPPPQKQKNDDVPEADLEEWLGRYQHWRQRGGGLSDPKLPCSTAAKRAAEKADPRDRRQREAGAVIATIDRLLTSVGGGGGGGGGGEHSATSSRSNSSGSEGAVDRSFDSIRPSVEPMRLLLLKAVESDENRGRAALVEREATLAAALVETSALLCHGVEEERARGREWRRRQRQQQEQAAGGRRVRDRSPAQSCATTVSSGEPAQFWEIQRARGSARALRGL